ncbi:MAG: DUF4159 domain-containing protein [Planctomycetes bacterium]|nr:DUF4159 domain-containing protein [Planctomycetota bacterium]
MQRRNLSILVSCCAAALLCAPAGALERGKVTPQDVQRALERGRAALIRNLTAYRNQGEPGYRILCLMALLNSGVKPNDPKVADDIADLARRADSYTVEQYTGSYRAGLLLMMLAMTKDPKYRDTAAQMARRLQRHQGLNGSWGDNSRSQYALLGLKAAEDMGVEVPDTIYQSARKMIEAGQGANGGWGYTHQSGEASYGSMSVAGLTSLFITGGRLYRGTKTCGQGESDKRLVKGLEWMARNFTVTNNPGQGGMGYHYYYLYGLERVGVLMAQRTIGGHDWYREGAEFLVRAQNNDGSWYDDVLGTEFAMLFLGKGSAPIAMQKLRYGRDWNTDPYDAKELTEQAARDLDTPMTWQVTDTSASAEELSAAPILYLQGHRACTFDDDFRKNLKLFVDNGGFVFASACCGAKEFDESFRAEMKKIFPDSDFEALAPDHPIYNLKHKIAKQEAFMIEGLNTGCRTSVFYAPHDICCAWGGCEGCKDEKNVAGDEAKKLGVNLIAYAIGFNRLKDKLENVQLMLKATDAKVERGALVIGQLYHNGEWDPDPASIPNLTQTLREQAGMKGTVAKRRVVLGTDDPGEYPVLYMTGHKKFEFTAEQVKVLRAYLDKGGFLFADPCCGKAEFDIAFRKLCSQLYHDAELERLPKDHAVLSAPFKIESVEYKTAVKRFFPDVKNDPYLEGISAKGRLAILYSRFNLGCELHGHACGSCLGVKGQDAYKIAVNAILYALAH